VGLFYYLRLELGSFPGARFLILYCALCIFFGLQESCIREHISFRTCSRQKGGDKMTGIQSELKIKRKMLMDVDVSTARKST